MSAQAPWGHPGEEGREPVLLRQRYRVKMADVDATGVIYYAAPLRWQEAMSTEWMATIGHPLSEMLVEGQGCPCVESGARYLGPLRLDEVVELRQVLEALGKRSFRSRMDVLGTGGQLVVQARSHLVWTEKDARGVPRACPLPDWLQAALLDPPATTTAVPA